MINLPAPAQTMIFVVRNAIEVLLLTRYKKPHRGLMTGVGGKCKEGETPLDCAIRETYEETGLRFTPDDMHFLGIVAWQPEADGPDMLPNTPVPDHRGMAVYMCDLMDSRTSDPQYRKAPGGEGKLSWRWLGMLYGGPNLAPHLRIFMAQMLLSRRPLLTFYNEVSGRCVPDSAPMLEEWITWATQHKEG